MRLPLPVFVPLLLTCLHAAAAPVAVADHRTKMHDGAALVGIACDEAKQTLEIGFFYPSAPPEAPMALWDARSLVEFDPVTFNVSRIHTIDRNCTLGETQYRIVFTGVPGAANAQAQCGADTTAEARVFRDGRPLFRKVLASCQAGTHLRLVRFAPGAGEPVIEAATPGPAR